MIPFAVPFSFLQADKRYKALVQCRARRARVTVAYLMRTACLPQPRRVPLYWMKQAILRVERLHTDTSDEPNWFGWRDHH